MDVDEIRREDLNHLLTTCRARIEPAEVHLDERAGHRAPGLRQNDIAALAGVSTRWYATLERGEHRVPRPGCCAASPTGSTCPRPNAGDSSCWPRRSAAAPTTPTPYPRTCTANS